MELVSRKDFEKIRELPLFKGVIVSDSMVPLLKVGEKIIVDVGNKDLQRFDLIVFWSDNKLICHFVWAMNRTITPFLLQTRNLKKLGKDVPISWDDYLGKVCSHKFSSWSKFWLVTRLWLKLRK